MANITYPAGIATAYGAAVRGGYTGTYEDFCRQQAQYAESAAAVEQAKEDAEAAASAAEGSKTAAAGSASAAATSAGQASTSATNAANSATAANASKNAAATSATEAENAATSAAGSAATAQGVLESIPPSYDDLADEVADLKEDLNEYLLDKYETVNPTNWLDLNSITNGELYKNGTIVASTTRFYTDYIPVDVDSVIQCFRGDNFNPLYRYHIACYDENKNILSTLGTDNANTGTYTIALLSNPDAVKFVRVTLGTDVLSLKPMITLDGVPNKYTAYFEPYSAIIEDFLTEESETALQKVVNNELSTNDLKNNYGFAFPLSSFRQTIGLPQTWYYDSMVSPKSVYANIGVGSQYGNKIDLGLSLPNSDALNSVNGYTFSAYDVLLNRLVLNTDFGSAQYGFERHIVAENLSDCSLLAIGDSTVDQDTMTATILSHFSEQNKTITLLGTLGDGSGNNRNEGRAGWKATDYLTNKQYDGVTNPFYNPSSETFDFEYYMTNQGYTGVDFVVLQLGINDLYNIGYDGTASAIETTWNAIKTMIDSIRAYSSTTKIILNLPTTPNSDDAQHTASEVLYRNRVIRYNGYAIKQVKSQYNSNNVRCSYCHLILNSSTEIRDNVHPTTLGYEKMALEVVNQINCWQNGV